MLRVTLKHSIIINFPLNNSEKFEKRRFPQKFLSHPRPILIFQPKLDDERETVSISLGAKNSAQLKNSVRLVARQQEVKAARYNLRTAKQETRVAHCCTVSYVYDDGFNPIAMQPDAEQSIDLKLPPTARLRSRPRHTRCVFTPNHQTRCAQGFRAPRDL